MTIVRAGEMAQWQTHTTLAQPEFCFVLTSGGSSLSVTSVANNLTPSFSPCRLPGPCMDPGAALTGSSEGWGKETHRHGREELAGNGGLDFPIESLSPWKLSVFIIYIWTRKWGYYLLLNKEAELAIQIVRKEGFMVWSWIKEIVLANLSRSSSCCLKATNI